MALTPVARLHASGEIALWVGADAAARAEELLSDLGFPVSG